MSHSALAIQDARILAKIDLSALTDDERAEIIAEYRDHGSSPYECEWEYRDIEEQLNCDRDHARRVSIAYEVAMRDELESRLA